jgi:hypothetical protein
MPDPLLFPLLFPLFRPLTPISTPYAAHHRHRPSITRAELGNRGSILPECTSAWDVPRPRDD